METVTFTSSKQRRSEKKSRPLQELPETKRRKVVRQTKQQKLSSGKFTTNKCYVSRRKGVRHSKQRRRRKRKRRSSGGKRKSAGWKTKSNVK
jgi:hypothetical protein